MMSLLNFDSLTASEMGWLSETARSRPVPVSEDVFTAILSGAGAGKRSVYYAVSIPRIPEFPLQKLQDLGYCVRTFGGMSSDFIQFKVSW